MAKCYCPEMHFLLLTDTLSIALQQMVRSTLPLSITLLILMTEYLSNID